MREPIRDRQRLEHMIASIDNILQFVEGKTEESLSTEKVLFYAIVKNIEIVGEAAFKLTKAFLLSTFRDTLACYHEDASYTCSRLLSHSGT